MRTRVHWCACRCQCLYVQQGGCRYAVLMISRDDASPLHEQVADDIRRRVRAGEFEVGAKLPSLKDLRDRYGVAEVTVHTAIRELQREGIVVSSQGRGTFVAAVPDESAEIPDPGAALRKVQEDVAVLARRVERLERAVGGGESGSS